MPVTVARWMIFSSITVAPAKRVRRIGSSRRSLNADSVNDPLLRRHLGPWMKRRQPKSDSRARRIDPCANEPEIEDENIPSEPSLSKENLRVRAEFSKQTPHFDTG